MRGGSGGQTNSWRVFDVGGAKGEAEKSGAHKARVH